MERERYSWSLHRPGEHGHLGLPPSAPLPPSTEDWDAAAGSPAASTSPAGTSTGEAGGRPGGSRRPQPLSRSSLAALVPLGRGAPLPSPPRRPLHQPPSLDTTASQAYLSLDLTSDTAERALPTDALEQVPSLDTTLDPLEGAILAVAGLNISV